MKKKKRSERFLAPKCSSRIVSASSNDDCSVQNRPSVEVDDLWVCAYQLFEYILEGKREVGPRGEIRKEKKLRALFEKTSVELRQWQKKEVG